MTSYEPSAFPRPGASAWAKASRSDNANACVEVMYVVGVGYRIRDSKARGLGPEVVLSVAEWGELCRVMQLDARLRLQTRSLGSIDVIIHPDGSFDLNQRLPGMCHVSLHFTRLERECFVDGVRMGEFSSVRLLRLAKLNC